MKTNSKYSECAPSNIFAVIAVYGANLLLLSSGRRILTSVFNISQKDDITVNFIIYGILFLLSTGIFFRPLRESILAFFKQSPREIGTKAMTTLGIGATCFIIQGIFTILIRRISDNESGLSSMAKTDQMPLILYFIVFFVLLGPIVEEITYRYAIFRWFEKWNVIVAYIVSSVLFGIAHVWMHAIFDGNWMSLLDAIPYCIMGGGFSLIYEKTKNLCFPICLHIVFNAIAAISYFA